MALDSLTQLQYDEYVRICNLCDSHIKDEHNDFKLLGGIGLLIPALPAVLKYYSEEYDPLLLFVGFLAILIFFVVIAFKDLLRLSIISFYIKQFKEYEDKIRTASVLKGEKDNFLAIAGDWGIWTDNTHGKISIIFYSIIGVAIVLLPFFILLKLGEKNTMEGWSQNEVYSVCYLSISIFCAAFYAYAANILSIGRQKIWPDSQKNLKRSK